VNFDAFSGHRYVINIESYLLAQHVHILKKRIYVKQNPKQSPMQSATIYGAPAAKIKSIEPV
jgi:hypothetical protein